MAMRQCDTKIDIFRVSENVLRRSHILKTPSRWKFLDAFPSHLDSMASPLAWNPGASRIVEGQREKIVEADKLDYVIYLL